jgi:hypothetical protein
MRRLRALGASVHSHRPRGRRACLGFGDAGKRDIPRAPKQPTNLIGSSVT